jgi:hypothetical protein
LRYTFDRPQHHGIARHRPCKTEVAKLEKQEKKYLYKDLRAYCILKAKFSSANLARKLT